MRYSTRYPRHLSARSPRERGTVLGQFLLIAITIVIGGLLAMAVTRHGEPAATETPVAPEAQPRPTSPPPTAGTPATASAASAPAGGTPASSGTPAVGGGNLLANPGFEEGLDGWTAIGGAKLDLADESREGSLALGLTAGGGRAPGVSARHVTESEAHRSYTATAWIRTARAGTTAELNLVEYVGRRRLSTDTSGAVLPGGDWQRLEVTHVTHQAGSKLAVEVVVPDLAQGAGVAPDDLQVPRGPFWEAQKGRQDDHATAQVPARQRHRGAAAAADGGAGADPPRRAAGHDLHRHQRRRHGHAEERDPAPGARRRGQQHHPGPPERHHLTSRNLQDHRPSPAQPGREHPPDREHRRRQATRLRRPRHGPGHADVQPALHRGGRLDAAAVRRRRADGTRRDRVRPGRLATPQTRARPGPGLT